MSEVTRWNPFPSEPDSIDVVAASDYDALRDQLADSREAYIRVRTERDALRDAQTFLFDGFAVLQDIRLHGGARAAQRADVEIVGAVLDAVVRLQRRTVKVSGVYAADRAAASAGGHLGEVYIPTKTPSAEAPDAMCLARKVGTDEPLTRCAQYPRCPCGGPEGWPTSVSAGESRED